MLLKHWQVWSIDHLSRKPVPVFNHSVSNKMLSTIRSEPLLVQFWTLPMPLVTGAQEEEISTSLSASPSCLESNQFVPQHSSLQTRHAQSHDTQDIPSSLLNIFATLLWTHLNSFTSFFNCRAQNSTQRTGEAAPALTTVARSPLLTGFLWCVQCAPGCALPSWQWRSDTPCPRSKGEAGTVLRRCTLEGCPLTGVLLTTLFWTPGCLCLSWFAQTTGSMSSTVTKRRTHNVKKQAHTSISH